MAAIDIEGTRENAMATIRLTREELYEAAWTEPMRILAPRYGLSDVGLAKTCKRMKVPVPGRGYWAKKAAGRTPKRIPLPALPPNATGAGAFLTLNPGLPPAEQEQQPRVIANQERFESAPENRIVVKDTLRFPHPLIKKTATALRDPARPSAPAYRDHRDTNLDVQVSKELLPRALRIMNALVLGLEARGWKVSIGAEGSPAGYKTYVTVLRQRVAFGIREKLRKVDNQLAKAPWESKVRDVYSGTLALVIRSRWGTGVERSLADTIECPVEERLNDFVLAIVERAHYDLEWEAGTEDSERERQIERDRREAQARQRQRDLDRVQSLEKQAADWSRSQALVLYLSAVREVANRETDKGPSGDAFHEWLSWAEAHAADLNPLRKPLTALVGSG